MLITALIIACAWVMLTSVGWVVLGPLERRMRDGLLPTAPLVGVVSLVVVLHTTSLVLSVRAGVWVVGATLLVIVVVATRRDRTWWRPDRRALAALVLTAACGAAPAVWLLAPSVATGDSGVIQPSLNNDAFYYVSLADWLQDHPSTQRPETGPTPETSTFPPSFGPAQTQLETGLRIGQELVHAALATALGADTERAWYPLTALWVLLLPASGIAAARYLRLSTFVGLALGTTTAVSALVVFQFAQQNSDSLLGTALVFPAVGATMAAVSRRHPYGSRWLAALLLTGLVGAYPEFMPLVAPALVVAVLARARADIPRAVRSAVALLGLGLAMGLPVWVRAATSLLFLGGIESDQFPTAFTGEPVAVLLGRFLGVMSFEDGSAPVVLLAICAAFVATGVAAALVLSSRRWVFGSLLAVGLFLAIYMVTVRDRPYTQQRVLQFLLPLVLLVVAVGWDRLWRRARDRDRDGTGPPDGRARRAAAIVAVLGTVGAVAMVGANARVNQAMDLASKAEHRHVGPEFAQAARWVRRLAGADGSQAMVLVGDFFAQLWISDALRDTPKVSYPTLYRSYQRISSYWDGDPRRWLLVDRSALTVTAPGVIVRSNDRFMLLDLSLGPAVVAVPADEKGHNSYLVLRSRSGPRSVFLTGSTRERQASDPAFSPGFGSMIGAQLRPGATSLRVDLRRVVSRRLVLNGEHDIFMLSGIEKK